MMKNFSLPTPNEVDYYQSSHLDAALEKIKQCINSKVFRFKPDSALNWYQMKDKLNAIIGQFGWKISTEWFGTKDDGYDIWVIKPI